MKSFLKIFLCIFAMITAVGEVISSRLIIERLFIIPDISPYVYCAGNPIKYIDPDGMDWYEGETKKMLFDDKINSQKDLDAAGIKGTYLGDSGTGIDEETGERLHYKADGTTSSAAHWISDVTISAKMSDHARIMSSPGTQSVHQGQMEFVDGLGDFFNYLGDVLNYGTLSPPPPEQRPITGTPPIPGRFKGGRIIKRKVFT